MFLLIVLFLSYLLPLCCSGTQPKPPFGPFKTSFVSVKDCSNPSRPYMNNPPMIFTPFLMNIDGKNLFGGNLTILREFKDMKTNVKCFAWRNDRWRQTFGFNNLNCHNTMIHITYAATGVNYDKKTCTFKKGFYSFQNLDINKLQHIWVPTMPYGRLLWRSEAVYKNGMVVCNEFDTITEPAV